jgi:hypothetical protein
MGLERRLPDGGAKLCGRALAIGEADGSRTAAPAARKIVNS